MPRVFKQQNNGVSPFSLLLMLEKLLRQMWLFFLNWPLVQWFYSGPAGVCATSNLLAPYFPTATERAWPTVRPTELPFACFIRCRDGGQETIIIALSYTTQSPNTFFPQKSIHLGGQLFINKTKVWNLNTSSIWNIVKEHGNILDWRAVFTTE